MKKALLILILPVLLSACTQMGKLGPGEIMGTDIGQVLLEEAGGAPSAATMKKANDEIDKALYFSPDGLTTQWYVGHDMRMRPLREVANRSDRTCRRFRHGQFLDGRWHNGTALACRENNVAWYLISNQWDDRSYPPRSSGDSDQGRWDNLSGELGSNARGEANDDFSGHRNQRSW